MLHATTCYKNLSQDEKKLVEYRKKYYKVRKIALL